MSTTGAAPAMETAARRLKKIVENCMMLNGGFGLELAVWIVPVLPLQLLGFIPTDGRAN